jgi:hypothetical protein
MHQMFIVLCFAFTVSAAPISIGPIYMSGGGTYSWHMYSGPDVVFSASDSSGSDYASLLGIDNGADIVGCAFTTASRCP